MFYLSVGKYQSTYDPNSFYERFQMTVDKYVLFRHLNVLLNSELEERQEFSYLYPLHLVTLHVMVALMEIRK